MASKQLLSWWDTRCAGPCVSLFAGYQGDCGLGRRERAGVRPLLCWQDTDDGGDTQLQCMDSSCSWGQLRCFPEVSLNVDSIRASVSMVTCAKLMDCVCEQKWCMLGLGNKGLIAHNRKFIFNWAKVIQGKTRKLKGSIKTLCKDSPKSHYLNSTKKKIFPFNHRQPFRFFLSVLFLIQSAIITTF